MSEIVLYAMPDWTTSESMEGSITEHLAECFVTKPEGEFTQPYRVSVTVERLEPSDE